MRDHTPSKRKNAMIVIRLIFLCACFLLLNGCSNAKEVSTDNPVIQYEIVNLNSCAFINDINGIGHIYSNGVTEKIGHKENYFIKHGDIIYLEKGVFLIIGSSDNSKIILGYSDKKSSFLISLDESEFKDCN